MIDYPIDISLNPYIGRLVTLDTSIGNESLTLLLDTGAGKTGINPAVAQRLGYKISGRSVGFRMSGEIVEFQYCHDVPLSIGGITINHDLMGVWDIHSILPKELPPLDGFLSLNTFKNHPFTLDLKSKKLTLESQETYKNRITNMNKLQTRIGTGMDGTHLDIFVYSRIEDQSGWFLLDSGNLDAILVSNHITNKLHNKSKENSEVWESEFNFNNCDPITSRIRTEKLIYDGVISEEFMRKWIFTFDLGQNSVWCEKSD